MIFVTKGGDVMTIWFDMTNSMQTWKGGLTGIVRVEIETAIAAFNEDKSIRFCYFDGSRYLDATDELKWLVSSGNYTDEYLKRNNITNSDTNNSYPELNAALHISDSRLIRVKEAVRMLCEAKGVEKNSVFWKSLKGMYKLLRNVADYRYKVKHSRMCETTVKQENQSEDNTKNQYPFREGDRLFSCGWYTSGKEHFLSNVKKEIENFHISYMIYDLVLINPETSRFYNEYNDFKCYLHWISKNCDLVFYWGKTAQRDTEDFFKENGWNVPLGIDVYYCSKINSNSNWNASDIDKFKEKYSISDNFILMVGSIEPKKNYDVIYNAYCIMSSRFPNNEIPQCVIVGSNFGNCSELVNCMVNNPDIKGKFVFVRATDGELDYLYKNAKFTMVPSFYEGWSIVLAEMLSYGKLCLVSDIDPLREVANDISIFIDPRDPDGWAEKIHYYFTNVEMIKNFENKVKENWNHPTWQDGAKKIISYINNIKDENYIFFDLTLAYAYSFSETPGLTGIPRSVLLLAKYLDKYVKNIRYFAITDMGYFKIHRDDITNILTGDVLDDDFIKDSKKLRNLLPVTYCTKNSELDLLRQKEHYELINNAKWLFASVTSGKIREMIIKTIPKCNVAANVNNIKDHSSSSFEKSLDVPFFEGDIVISLGPGMPEWLQLCLEREKVKKNFKIVQTIYDMTPVLFPQTHNEMTIEVFCNSFLPHVFRISDYIIYGGETAKRDGEKYAVSQKFNFPTGFAVKWGNDINSKQITLERENELLKLNGIKSNFILTVGTVQRRKNQEMLYNAIIRLINENKWSDVQLVIAGYPGWGYDGFLRAIKNDERVKDSIVILTATDELLDVLYRRSLFTLLPSLYEGWSLTLPESLGYGKFCIAADNEPLKEIGGNLIDYVNPYDIKGWADKINYYLENKGQLFKKERLIKEQWHSTSWKECAYEISKLIKLIEKGE